MDFHVVVTENTKQQMGSPCVMLANSWQNTTVLTDCLQHLFNSTAAAIENDIAKVVCALPVHSRASLVREL